MASNQSMENLTQSLQPPPPPTTTITTSMKCSKNEDVCISPNNRYDDILTNINKSNKRLRHKLSKMPPLPKYTSFKPSKLHLPTTTTTTTANIKNYTAFDKSHCASCKPNCFHDFGVIGETTTTKYLEAKRAHTCWHTPAKEFKMEEKPHCCFKAKPCQKSMHGQNTISNKTEPLPCSQQHLVFNQTCSDEAKQHPSQSKELTGTAEDENSSQKNTIALKCERNRNLSTQRYFQELLKRDIIMRGKETVKCKNQIEFINCCKCKKRPRPPVKVDINVRLIPKSTSSKVKFPKDSSRQENEDDIDFLPIDIAQHTINELQDLPNIDDKRPQNDELDMQSTQL